jgi:hypothetical protein
MYVCMYVRVAVSCFEKHTRTKVSSAASDEYPMLEDAVGGMEENIFLLDFY